ncbi:MAG TPA: M56 family metallopeptidase [Patescibacteria group bacterium]|nr:M56 family metallopeptidase [Patescibacteria group bacterium]
MKAELHTFCAHLTGAVLNGTYQGIILAFVVALLLRCWGRANAATKHAIWFAALLLVVLLVPAHYLLDRATPQQESRGRGQSDLIDLVRGQVRKARLNEPHVAFSGLGLEGAASEGDLPGANQDWAVVNQPNSLDRPISVEEEALAPVVRADEGAGLAGVGGLKPSLNERVRWLDTTWLWAIPFVADSATGSALVMGLTLSWLVISSARLVVLVWRLHQLRRISREAFPANNEKLIELFETLRTKAMVRREVKLGIIGGGRCPMVLGFLRPTVLLPGDIAQDPAAVEHVLSHELAHVRRYDDWANLIQHLAQGLLFFHPAVLWIGKRLSLEREIACDDHVLQQGGSRRKYALLLTNVAERIQQRTPLLAPGVSNNRSQLQQRISMILNTRRNTSPNLAKARLASFISVAVAGSALALYWAPRLVLAGTTAAPALTLRSGAATATLSAPGASAAVVSAPADPASGSAVLAQADGASAAVAGVETGPKFKPEPAAEPVPPGEIAPPEAPEAPSVDAAPPVPKGFPRVVRAGKPGKGRQPLDSLDAVDPAGADGSIEERLRKLEKMVRALMEQPGGKHSRNAFEFKDRANQNFNMDQQQIEQMNDKMKDLEERQSARAAEQAKRAEEQGRRAEEQAKRATRDLQARIEQGLQGGGEPREMFEKQLEALRKAREGLGREMERLDRQIQKLEQEQQRGEKDGQPRRSEARTRFHADVNVAPDIDVNPGIRK